MDTKDLQQSIGMNGIANARELGGYPAADGRTVKHGVLLRTARLSTADEEDLRRLRDEYRLAKVIDLRSDEEINGSPLLEMFTGSSAPDPDPLPEGAEYLQLAVLDLQKQTELTEQWQREHPDASVNDPAAMIGALIETGLLGDELYFGFLDEQLGKDSYSRLFRELLSLKEGRALLFHCTQGKDRTGVAAMLILSALGVSEDIIVSDYMLTNDYNRDKIEAERKMLTMSGRVPPEKIDLFMMAMDRVNETTMTNVISHVRERYGSVRDYIISELGISESELVRLGDRFLE